ncbi:hypothetical protein BFP76_03485 [Amylibacter kogurei]|uniref:Uncharacterized protein n=1 Tax=Paramylibacter kogurei TaxID=1889778 RepID=A0A2G5K433_9RHOB|nr:hypothetical protein [Amylibacter kogurei]PIB24296.1 hypothetical protein BFP76_03485 [Amylibacter kogurei]
MSRFIQNIIRVLIMKGMMQGVRRVMNWWGDRQAWGQDVEQAKVIKDQTRKNTITANRLVRMIRRFGRF